MEHSVEYICINETKDDKKSNSKIFINNLKDYLEDEGCSFNESNEIKFEGFVFVFDILSLNHGIYNVILKCFDCESIKDRDDEPIDNEDEYGNLKVEYKKIDTFLKLKELFLKNIKVILGSEPLKIYDSYENNILSTYYPLICELENNLRYIITKYMFIKERKEWYRKCFPKDIKPRGKEKNYDSLYNIDFIKLKDFLLNNYPDQKKINIVNKIKRNKNFNLTNEEILILLDENNWDKYFYLIFNMDSNVFGENWGKLYKIRNKIAHSNTLSKEEIENLEKLFKEFNETFKIAKFIIKKKYIIFLEEFDKFQNYIDNEKSIPNRYKKHPYKYYYNISSSLYNDLKKIYYMKKNLFNLVQDENLFEENYKDLMEDIRSKIRGINKKISKEQNVDDTEFVIEE